MCENYIADKSSEHYGNDNSNKRKAMIKIIKLIIASELTQRQRELCKMYYFDKMSMPQIANQLGISKSTVSRTIARGISRINDCVKYYKLR